MGARLWDTVCYGVGKTTFFHSHLAAAGFRFVNADVLGAELVVEPYEAARLVSQGAGKASSSLCGRGLAGGGVVHLLATLAKFVGVPLRDRVLNRNINRATLAASDTGLKGARHSYDVKVQFWPGGNDMLPMGYLAKMAQNRCFSRFCGHFEV